MSILAHLRAPSDGDLPSPFRNTTYMLANGAAVALTIEPDPLGPINSVVRIRPMGVTDSYRARVLSWNTRHPARAALVRIEPGDFVTLFAEVSIDADTRFLEPGYRVAVNGRTVLSIRDSELRPLDHPEKRPPLRQRLTGAVRGWLSVRSRDAADRIAHRFGYVREDHWG